MVNCTRLWICILAAVVLLGAGTAHAQISPGELTAAHASLEGMTSCTSCHAMGKAIANDKCLACHAEVAVRAAAGRGYHATVTSRPCAECHKEHFGRDFTLIRFDERSFDHSSIGFTLTGKHKTTECRTCHAPRNIRAADIRKNSRLLGGKTFLGLSPDCAACHADAHAGQLGNACSGCHTTEQWKPASRFTHERAKFRLTGRHSSGRCEACHVQTADGKTRKFVGLAFSTCASCHTDPHQGKFKKPCESCHTPEGWREGAARGFDHAATRFPLRGKHRTAACSACHVPSRTSEGGKSTQRFAIAKFGKCSDCHTDTHAGEFASRRGGGECSECHTEDGYVPARFDHSTAQFAIEGKHAAVACVRCHPARKSPTAQRTFRVDRYRRCGDCHTDAHAGQFTRRKDGGECVSCHAVTGFVPAAYPAGAHESARFPLTGGHAAVPCGACHTAGAVRAASSRRFLWPQPVTCETCHRDVHGGQFAERFPAGCTGCHDAGSWEPSRFKHQKTRFPLDGKHASVRCAMCHTSRETSRGERMRVFGGTPRRCDDCHRGEKS